MVLPSRASRAFNRSVLVLFLIAASTFPTARPAARTASKAPTACLALTRSDVQFALGRTVGKPEEENSAAASTCDYASDRGRVSVTVQRLDRDLDLSTEVA